MGPGAGPAIINLEKRTVFSLRTEEFLAFYCGIPGGGALSALAGVSAVRHLAPGETLIRAGERQMELALLAYGTVRGYYFDGDGQEITDCIVAEPGMPVLAGSDLEEPARLCVEAVTETELVAVPAGALCRLILQHPELLRACRRVMARAWSAHWESRTVAARWSAVRRYEWFLRRYPGLSGQVSQKHIASFLGMTPVTLSRVRRKARERAEEDGT